MYRTFIPARPIHLAVFGGAAIAANLLGVLTADDAIYVGLAPVLVLLVASIAIDVLHPPSYTQPEC